MDILQRVSWYGEPARLGEGWRLRKMTGAAGREAVCQLFSHQFGWELGLTVAGELLRSEVCRSQDDVLRVCEQWKAAMLAKGWQ
jgi:hypothetical protein